MWGLNELCAAGVLHPVTDMRMVDELSCSFQSCLCSATELVCLQRCVTISFFVVSLLLAYSIGDVGQWNLKD